MVVLGNIWKLISRTLLAIILVHHLPLAEQHYICAEKLTQETLLHFLMKKQRTYGHPDVVKLQVLSIQANVGQCVMETQQLLEDWVLSLFYQMKRLSGLLFYISQFTYTSIWKATEKEMTTEAF